MALSPASGSFSSVSAGIDDSCLTEMKDHKMDGAGGSAEMQAGRPLPAVTPSAVSGRGLNCVEGLNPAPHIHEQKTTSNYV